MQIGERIKKFRKNINISQEELADMVFTSRQTISNWENDKTYPDINSLKLLCNIFDLSLDNLIEGDIENMKRKIYERVSEIKQILGENVKYSQVQIVGPKIGGELVRGGILAILVSFLLNPL